MIQKLSLSFSNYSDANLQTLSESILLSMTNNPNFPNPTPTIADFSNAVGKYSDALVLAKSGGKLPVALKNEGRQELEAMLTAMALFVMCVAGGNVAMLTGSGFILTKPRTPQKLGDPGTISLSNGINTGELTVNLKPVKGGRSYMHEISADPLLAEGSWTSVFSSTSKYTFTNLEQGKKYAARVLVVGSGTQTVYTPVATMFVQ